MMLKRIFWLLLAAGAGWLLWTLWRQRQADSVAVTPQLAPLGRYDQAPVPPVSAPAPPARVSAPPIAPADPAPAPSPVAPADPAPAPSPVTPADPAPAPSLVAPADPAPAPSPVAPVVEAAAPPAEPAAELTDALSDIRGYCPRCKTKRQIGNVQEIITESGRRAARGTCPVCSGKMFTFLPNK